ncbi:hypothetical protein [Acinetobacter bereziniae]|nr:hypothetical protein [Acinetobacter bereziniae]
MPIDGAILFCKKFTFNRKVSAEKTKSNDFDLVWKMIQLI